MTISEKHQADEDIRWKPPGRLHRYRILLLLILASVVVGPAVGRFAESYRGIVLERQDEQALLAYAQRAPEWKEDIDGTPGTIIQKDRWRWHAERSQAEPRDLDLTQLYERYVKTYSGTIVAIQPPHHPGGAATAVVERDDGGRERIAIWADHLSTATVGSRVHKRPASWDPNLTDK